MPMTPVLQEGNTMRWISRWIVAVSAAALLLAAYPAVSSFGTALAQQGYASETRRGFNDEYVFATTKGLSDMDVNPALKVTLFPVTVVLDVAFLPFALIAGAVT
jgi:hypothetical protein